MVQELLNKTKLLSVTGLGYVGLPLALAFAKKIKVIAFDTNAERVALMQQKIDPSHELKAEDFEGCDIVFTHNEKDLAKAHFHIIAVPTDIDEYKVPNLQPLLAATQSVAKALKNNDFVIFESTVYPGCTEDDCLPLLEYYSKLKGGSDFSYGYSPERIVPGDKVKNVTTINKVISANTVEALEVIEAVYSTVITAELYKASSIKVAEAAKVIENTQRDLNISLVNELAIIFDKLGINTNEVIEAAGTKWNFIKYKPGLVGGHCISVDPYYLIHKAKQLGVDPQVIAAGRRVNDYIPSFIAKKCVQTLIEQGKNPSATKVLVMGITFKENVTDIRNSKVVELIKELQGYSINVHVTDPLASVTEVAKAYGITLITQLDNDYDAIIITVAHNDYKLITEAQLTRLCKPNYYLFDIKGIKSALQLPNYWEM